MNRYYFEEAETFMGEPNDNSGFLRFGISQNDQPRRSPIRRRDKFPQEMGVKSKSKRDFKKVQNKIKYDWQGE